MDVNSKRLIVVCVGHMGDTTIAARTDVRIKLRVEEFAKVMVQ